MASAPLKLLEKQLRILRRTFLPKNFDPTGTYRYASKVQTSALAYRVLSHAEIEAYFEQATLMVANNAYNVWISRKVLTQAGFALIAFSGLEMQVAPETLAPPQSSRVVEWNKERLDVGGRLEKAHNAFSYKVRKINHGIKEENILALLLPVGIDYRDIDPLFLAQIESFGTSRGAVAHSSMSSVRAANPKDEYDMVSGLMVWIRDIDAKLVGLMV